MSPLRAFALLLVAALGSTAVADHGMIVDLEGVRACTDELSVRATFTDGAGSSAMLEGLARDLRGTLISLRDRRSSAVDVTAECATGAPYLSLDVHVRELDPAKYQGFPEGAHAIGVTLEIGPSDPEVLAGSEILFRDAYSDIVSGEGTDIVQAARTSAAGLLESYERAWRDANGTRWRRVAIALAGVMIVVAALAWVLRYSVLRKWVGLPSEADAVHRS